MYPITLASMNDGSPANNFLSLKKDKYMIKKRIAKIYFEVSQKFTKQIVSFYIVN